MAPSIAPSMIGRYSSGQSFSLWLTRCRCSLSSRMISGLKYRSTGRPQFLISCMITGKLGIVPSFSIFARYRQSIFTFSAIALRDKCFAFRAAFTSAPKVSKPGQMLCFPCCFYICTESFKAGAIFDIRHIASPTYIVYFILAQWNVAICM